MNGKEEIKQVEELVAIGGIFYEIDGQSFCDTPTATWRLIVGRGYVRLNDNSGASQE